MEVPTLTVVCREGRPPPASPSYATLAGEKLDHENGLRPNASDTATYIGA